MTANASAVDRLYTESKSIISALPAHEISLHNSAGDLFRKTLVLAAASYFENRVTGIVMSYVEECSANSPKIVSIVRTKAVARQYHTWFSWKDGAKGVNTFHAMFGDEFKSKMTLRLRSVAELLTGASAFIEIGNDRNLMIHQDFATFSFDKTLEEIFSTYKKALVFVNDLETALRE